MILVQRNGLHLLRLSKNSSSVTNLPFFLSSQPSFPLFSTILFYGLVGEWTVDEVAFCVALMVCG